MRGNAVLLSVSLLILSLSKGEDRSASPPSTHAR